MVDNKDTAEINWAETILLPKTDFPMRANLPDAEPAILKKWEVEDIYHQKSYQFLECNSGQPLRS